MYQTLLVSVTSVSLWNLYEEKIVILVYTEHSTKVCAWDANKSSRTTEEGAFKRSKLYPDIR